MGLHKLYHMVFALALVCMSLAEDICVYTSCVCAYNKVTCTNLTSIPPLVRGSNVMKVYHVMLMTGGISRVDDSSLPPNLTVIHFNNNPITYISANAFQDSSASLDSIVFRNLAFSKLPDALLTLKNLSHLGVFDTPISDWNAPVIQHISKTLRSINFYNVNLGEWPEWLSEFSLLESVVIANSPIKPIPDNAFVNVTDTMKTLDLLSVNLQGVPKAISGLNLTGLSLSGNKLTDVRGIPKSKFIDLSYNAISEVGNLAAALITSADKLHTLYMESNNLTAIPDLTRMTQMKMLVLSQNQISDQTSGLLPQSLNSLDLTGNKLSSLPAVVSTLFNLTSLVLTSNLITEITGARVPLQLQELRLDDNKISQIGSKSFPIASSLTILNLKSNPIEIIDPTAFAYLQKLTDLILDDTKLVSVPLALTSLHNLNTLSIENIPGLSCTGPPDNSLVQWFKCSKVKEVQGSCDNGVSIQVYYSPSDGSSKPCGVTPILSSKWCIFVCLLMFFSLTMFSSI